MPICIYIYIYIIVIITLCWEHRFSEVSLAIYFYWPLLLEGPLNGIQCQWVDECMSLLVNQHWSVQLLISSILFLPQCPTGLVCLINNSNFESVAGQRCFPISSLFSLPKLVFISYQETLSCHFHAHLKMLSEILSLMYIFEKDLVLNNLQWLICNKTKPNNAWYCMDKPSEVFIRINIS